MEALRVRLQKTFVIHIHREFSKVNNTLYIAV